jgi:hypothetical protein
MLGYYKFAAGVCAIGVLVSLVVMLFAFPVGAILLIVNLISLNSANKQIEKLEKRK